MCAGTTDSVGRAVPTPGHISCDEQGDRLAERLDRHDEHWKDEADDADPVIVDLSTITAGRSSIYR
jgi:hypothetical protein